MSQGALNPSVMRKLILIKHSLPAVEPEIPANQWHLSEEGRLRCKSLADRIAGYQPNLTVSSLEPKAIETAQIITEHLKVVMQINNLRCETEEGLHEHDRHHVSFLPTEEFREKVATFFAHPEMLVFGEETATQARARFIQSVMRVLAKHTHGNVTIVAHGTVITLFVASYADIEPFAFWEALGLPSFVVMSLPDFKLKMIENIK